MQPNREFFEQQNVINDVRQESLFALPRRAAELDRTHVLHSKRRYWIGRRAQDIVLSLAALLVLWPLMLIIALVIWIDSPGASPIFAQERVGRDGKRFMFLNLRWMKTIDDLHREWAVKRPVSCAARTTKSFGRGFRHRSGHFKPVAAAESGAFRRPSEPAPIHRTA